MSTIETLLSEANKRSQFFVDKLWQIPLAYGGVSALFLKSINSTELKIPNSNCVIVIIIGFLILIHMIAMRDGNIRATKNLIAIEKEAKIEGIPDVCTAKLLSWTYFLPSIGIVVTIIILAFLALLKN